MPVRSDVEEMLKLHLAKVPLSADVDIAEIAELLVELNASGADVEGVCRSACSRAIREAEDRQSQLTSRLSVSHGDFLSSIREWRK
jgi:SpoVK/Ycf46/Vps4 family AAA+-type ATPase